MSFSNAATGAISGAGTGSIFGPVGTVAGGVIGALGGYFGGGSKKPKIKNYPLYNPEQMKLIDSYTKGAQELNPQAMEYIRNILSNDPQSFKNFEAPYMEKFQSQVVPQLAERFSGAGARSSSGFNQALSQAGRGLSQDLATMRENLRNSAMERLMQYNNLALTKTTQPYIQEGQQSAYDAMLPGAVNNLYKSFQNNNYGEMGQDALWSVMSLFGGGKVP